MKLLPGFPPNIQKVSLSSFGGEGWGEEAV